jgi:N-acetylneuraminic acid mutarotase
VFGGQTAAGPTDVIQRIDRATGAVAVAGRLPRPVQGAAALSLGGQIYVAGGEGTRAVLRFDPATSRVSAAGELPVPVGYGAAAVTGGTGYLVGGEDNGRRIVWQYGHTG